MALATARWPVELIFSFQQSSLSLGAREVSDSSDDDLVESVSGNARSASSPFQLALAVVVRIAPSWFPRFSRADLLFSSVMKLRFEFLVHFDSGTL